MGIFSRQFTAFTEAKARREAYALGFTEGLSGYESLEDHVGEAERRILRLQGIIVGNRDIVRRLEDRVTAAENRNAKLIKEIVVLTPRQRKYLIRQYARIAELEGALVRGNATQTHLNLITLIPEEV